MYNPSSARISGLDSVLVETGEASNYLIDSSSGTFVQIYELLEAKELTVDNLTII